MLVENVTIHSVTVHWQCCAYAVKQDQPSPTVSGNDLDDLRALNVYQSCTLQIGDRLYLNLLESDSIVTKEAWKYHRETWLNVKKNPVKPKGKTCRS